METNGCSEELTWCDHGVDLDMLETENGKMTRQEYEEEERYFVHFADDGQNRK